MIRNERKGETSPGKEETALRRSVFPAGEKPRRQRYQRGEKNERNEHPEMTGHNSAPEFDGFFLQKVLL